MNVCVLSVHSLGGKRGYTLISLSVKPYEQGQAYPSKGNLEIICNIS